VYYSEVFKLPSIFLTAPSKKLFSISSNLDNNCRTNVFQDKTQELKDIDTFLNMSPITSKSLKTIIGAHPDLIPDRKQDSEQETDSPGIEEQQENKDLQEVVDTVCITSPPSTQSVSSLDEEGIIK